MMIKIEINCDNVSFNDNLLHEISSILDSCKAILQHIDQNTEMHQKIFDANGNSVGWVSVTQEPTWG